MKIMGKKAIHGPGFTMTKDDEQGKSTKKDNLFVVAFLIGWIAWVVLYLLYLRPFVRYFFFNILGLSLFPAMIHMIPMLFIPAIFAISINYIIGFIKRLKRSKKIEKYY